MRGFIYAIGDGRGRVKIGWSRDPMRRLTKLRTDCPDKAVLLGLIGATRTQESETHEILARWRLNGEWFDHNAPAVQAFVNMLPPPRPRPLQHFGASGSHPLSKYRAERRISLKALAAEIGTTHATLSRYEAGKLHPPLKTARHIAHKTGLTVAAVLNIAEAAE